MPDPGSEKTSGEVSVKLSPKSLPVRVRGQPQALGSDHSHWGYVSSLITSILSLLTIHLLIILNKNVFCVPLYPTQLAAG